MSTPNPPLTDRYAPLDYALIAVIFSLLGAFFWAIRGTGGFGGMDGGILAGLGWAVLWYAFSNAGGSTRNRPLGNGYLVPAILLGIAFGGMTGYGVYISWLRGVFFLNHPEGVRDIAPWTGFTMLFFCGLHWGGVPGAFMAWCAQDRPATKKTWAERWACGIGAAVLAGAIVRSFPQWFLPFYDLGIYAVEGNKTCIRAQGSIENIAPHVGLYLGFLLYELLQRNARGVCIMLVMGLGFAIPFTVGGIWQTFYDSGISMPWWKFWEMSIGFGGGLAFALAFYLFNRPEEQHEPQPVVPRERIVAALIVCLAAASIASSTLEGLNKLHDLGGMGTPRIVAELFTVLAGAGAIFAWRRARPEDAAPIPSFIPTACLLLIIVAGFLVSTPLELQSHNRVLLSLYTCCMLGSAAACALLWARLRRT